MEGSIEFDWDRENKKHLAAHKVVPAEAEQVLTGEPLDLAFHIVANEVVGTEERYELRTVAVY